MRNKAIQSMFEAYITGNQANIGTMVTDLVNKNYGPEINEYLVPVINAICKMD